MVEIEELTKRYPWLQIIYSVGNWHIDVEDFLGKQQGSDGRTLKEAIKKLKETK